MVRMTKKPKPPKNTGPFPAQVDAISLAKGALSLVPGLNDALDAIEKAQHLARERRKAQWITYVAQGEDDPAEFAAHLNASLSSTESDATRTAILEGARAAVDAVNEVVVPSIGLLTRYRLQNGRPTLRTYRELLSLLRSLDVDEFQELTAIVRKLAAMVKRPHVGPDDVNTVLLRERALPVPPEESWTLHAVIPWAAGYFTREESVPLSLGPIAQRLVVLLRGDDRSLFREPSDDEDTLFRRPGPRFTREMIETLQTILVQSKPQ
jgi:hypothetical protein